MFGKLWTFAIIALCAAQDYEDYEVPVRQSPGATRYVSQEQPKQQEQIAILKQINKHNEDGSYTYGYEGADGSFKIETKAANGDVKGKYGYVDGDGKVRVVEYGADKYGFQPSGEGITVAPINYNDVKEVDYEEELQQQQQFIARPKQTQKAPRPQSFNYAPAVIEKRKPTFAPTSAPAQYYDYEEEIPTSPRPIQIARPKYSIPAPQRPQQFGNDAGVVYAQERPTTPAAQYQQFDSRQPQQFPNASPASAPSRADQQFSLFSPASRADVFKPKIEQYSQEPFQYAQQPQAAPQQAFQRPSFASKPAQSRSTSILDQLAKDPNYVLPQSAPALHDISFGYSL